MPLPPEERPNIQGLKTLNPQAGTPSDARVLRAAGGAEHHHLHAARVGGEHHAVDAAAGQQPAGVPGAVAPGPRALLPPSRAPPGAVGMEPVPRCELATRTTYPNLYVLLYTLKPMMRALPPGALPAARGWRPSHGVGSPQEPHTLDLYVSVLYPQTHGAGSPSRGPPGGAGMEPVPRCGLATKPRTLSLYFLS